MKTRLGVVSFLNTQPLVWAFETGALDHDFDLVYDVPSRCAVRLHNRETDVALIPSIEIARGQGPYEIAPGLSLASRGPVRSVLLLLNKDPEDVRTLALDTSSRTSVVLSQVILRKRYHCRPDVFPIPPDPDRMLERADAALLIGDPALDLDPAAYRILDLGRAWIDLTGLPFVYACWTGRPGALSPAEIGNLLEAKALGLDAVSDIAEHYAATHLRAPSFYADYLTQNMRYDLGQAELEGLRRFYTYAFEEGFINRVPDVRFYPQA